jgi:nucleoside-specific outer membrane channel protein Tsx
MTLAQAPHGLQTAVQASLGRASGSATGSLLQAELTASDRARGNTFGWSVAVSGLTALVGAPDRNFSVGAAYVFVRSGTTWSQQAELTASDGASSDRFGASVALSGSTALVGDPYKNSSTGAAYVFVRSGTTWSQQAELTASDGVPNDDLGISVAVSGATVVVGAPAYQNASTGKAYVFVRSGTTWSQQAELTASDGAPNDELGLSVALSGSTAVVGAVGTNSGTGAAYVFVRSGTTWSQQAELTASDGTANDELGYSVAVSGSTALAGDPTRNGATGAAYVFVRSGTTWSQQAELTASDGGPYDDLGLSVALSGSTAVVGAPGKNSSSGTAYVFTRSGTTWSQQPQLGHSLGAADDNFGGSVAVSGSIAVVGAWGRRVDTGAAYVFALPSQQAELTASDGSRNDQFGYSVAVSGSTAVVGAPFKQSSTGAAYVFVRSGKTWSQQAKITASDGAPGDDFGTSVGLSGSTAVVGAPHQGSSTGEAYVFVRSGTTWSEQQKLTASDGAAGDSFGWSVAVSGLTAVVGAYGRSSDTGGAYVFAASGPTWSQQAELTASDGVAGDYFGESVAVSGSTALVAAPGKSSSTGAAYVFAASGPNWSQQAELFASDGAPGDSFGNSAAVSGSTAVVGASGKNVATGAAYVFGRFGTTWYQRAELTASGGASGDEFGNAVAVSGSTAVVGAYGKNSAAGVAYLFARAGTTWSQEAELTASDGAPNAQFGYAVALSKSTAVIGAIGKRSFTGQAYVFVLP